MKNFSWWLRPSIIRFVDVAVEPRFFWTGFRMNGLVVDDSIFHATLWMLLVLAAGVALLMIAFMLVTRCIRMCSRSAARRVESRSNIWPQV